MQDDAGTRASLEGLERLALRELQALRAALPPLRSGAPSDVTVCIGWDLALPGADAMPTASSA